MYMQVRYSSIESKRRGPGRPKGSKDKAPRVMNPFLKTRIYDITKNSKIEDGNICLSRTQAESIIFPSAELEFGAGIPGKNSLLYDDPFYLDWPFWN